MALTLQLDQAHEEPAGKGIEGRTYTVSVNVVDDAAPTVRLANFTVQGATRGDITAAIKEKFAALRTRLSTRQTVASLAQAALSDAENEVSP